VSASSYFEKRLKEVVETIEKLREEGYSWEELYQLECERRVLEWFVGMQYTLKTRLARVIESEQA
jgi:hypothetical protein